MKRPFKKGEALFLCPPILQQQVFGIHYVKQTDDMVCHVHRLDGKVFSANIGRWLGEEEHCSTVETEVKKKLNL